MISNVSFGSTYKVSTQNNGFDKFGKFQEFALNKEAENEKVFVELKDDMLNKYPYTYTASYTLACPDEMDSEVETYCANMGIQYKKFVNNDLMQPSAIEKRIAPPKEGMRLAKIDSAKLDKLALSQQTNLDHCENVYLAYYRENTEFVLRSGEEFATTTFDIISRESKEDVIEYIKRYGADKLNLNQTYLGFTQKTDKADHCMYFALRELGMKDIPVYMNNDTYEIAEAMGILK